MTNPTDTAAIERVARHLAAKDWATTPDGWDGATASFRAEYLALAREVIALAAPAAQPVSVVSGQTLRDRAAEALALRANGPASDGRGWFRDEEQRQSLLAEADAVLAVLPPDGHTTNQADVLSDAERTMLTYALDQAQEHIWSRDGFTDEDQAAITSLRRLAAEAPQPEPDAGVRQQPDDTPFVTRVLEIFAAADAHGELLWHIVDGQPQFSADVSDVFAWGGADCEPITPETLPVLEQALADLRTIGGEDFVADLYAARLRQMRPQGAAYPSGTHKAWREVSALYDACGPERELGLGNPKPAPAHRPAAVVPAAGAGQDETREGEAVVEPHCDGFPDTCPNPVTVPPAPPHHGGGIRCGCYDEESE